MLKSVLPCRQISNLLLCIILLGALGMRTAQAQTISQTRLAPTDGNRFGNAMAPSGSTLVVGDEFWSNSGYSTVGAAYVFTQASGQWTQQVELTASDGQPYDLFGSSVAADGSTVAVGAPFHNGTGAVYLFTQGKTGWTQMQEILPADGRAGDFFGAAVAMTNTTLAIGAYWKNSDAGAVYIYAQSKGKWVLQSELSAPSASADFGFSLSLSGTSLLVGAPGQNSGVGTAYVYTLSGGKWTQQAQLTPGDGQSGGQFGSAVALSGNVAAVGSPGKSTAYLYKSSGSGASVKWSQQAELQPFEGTSISGFGATIAMTASTLVVSAVDTDDRETYVFGLQKGNWTLVAELAPVDDAINNGVRNDRRHRR